MAVSLGIEVQRDEEVIGERKGRWGWQVYGTNGVALSMPQVVWAYRGQYRIENDWSRLKGRPLGLTPLYLQDEVRIQGLVYLLSLALRVLTLVEWVVRKRLQEAGSKVQGVYAGQPGEDGTSQRGVAAEGDDGDHRERGGDQMGRPTPLSPLTEVQKHLLELWGLPSDLYEKVARGFPKPPLDKSEP